MDREEKTILGGFTLIELLVIIVIIAILASVAVPTYIRTVEKARSGEAITNLELIRAGEKVYRLEIGAYSLDLDDTTPPTINAYLNLDIEPRFWTYEVAAAGSTTFTATATRDASAPGGYGGDTITINQDGWVSGLPGESPFQP